MNLNVNQFYTSNNSLLTKRIIYTPYEVEAMYERGIIQGTNISDASVNNAKIRNAYRAYASVVSILVGDGDTIDIQTAINAVNDLGTGGIILIRPGTYYPLTQLTLYDNISLVGLDPNSTIIDFSNAGDCSTGCIKIIGTDSTSTGTLSVTSGSTTITGDTTTFTNAHTGDLLVINGMAYVIATITNNTSLTITKAYRGKTETGISFNIWTSISNVNISGLSIINGINADTAGSGVVIDYADNCDISNCIITNNDDDGVDVQRGFNIKINNNVINSNAVNGLYLNEVSSSYILNNIITNNLGSGIKSDATIENTNLFIRDNVCNSNGIYGIHLFVANYHILSGNSLSSNTSHGIYLEGSSYNNIVGNNANNNGDDGFHLTNRISVNSDYNVVVSNTAANNTSNGINLTAGTNYNNASHNLLPNNGTDITDGGTGNTVWDNT